MEAQVTNVAEIPGKPPLQQSRFIRVLRAVLRKKTAVFGGLVLGLFVLIAILAPVLVPHDPSQQNLKLRLAPPIGLGLENASIEYPLGNDNLGRDVFSRLIVGSRVSLVVGVITVVLTTLLGSMLGAMAGYYRGRIDNASCAWSISGWLFPTSS